MFLTSALTVGQLTFILRAVIQILSYGGIFLIGYIVLASAPRIASLQTHDILNRIVGRETALRETRRWILNAIRGRTGDPVSSPRLVLAITLFSVYGFVVTLSDLGFLGFYTCNSSYTFLDRPASVNSTESAQALIKNALVNGTDPSTVKSHRCDSVEPIIGAVSIDTSDTVRVCTSWHNSTFADPSAFIGINTTDSDMLLPSNLRHQDQTRSESLDLNSYRRSFGLSRVLNTTIRNGLVAEPHESGLRVLFGAPSLQPRQSVSLEKNMALEVEVGCMKVGIFSSHDPIATGSGLDVWDKDNGKDYSGPENLRDILSKTVDEIRSYYSRMFSNSTEDTRYRTINSTFVGWTDVPQIASLTLPSIVNVTDGFYSADWIRGNCTESLRKQLQLDESMSRSYEDAKSAYMCSLVMVTGMVAQNGVLLQMGERMVCATSTQMNMVSGTVSVSGEGQVRVNMVRLPSDLNQLRADYFETTVISNRTIYNFIPFHPVLRYTLSDNPNGALSHFVYQNHDISPRSKLNGQGTGSAGNILSRVGSVMLDISALEQSENANLLGLGEFSLQPEAATRWFGQVGASYILNSLTYNGWVAASNPVVLVLDNGGSIGICYKPPYAVSFIPLIIAATVVISWILFLLVVRALSGVRVVEHSYGGVQPYVGVICPNTSAQSTLLVWERTPDPHLELVSQGQTIDDRTVAEHLRSSPQILDKLST